MTKTSVIYIIAASRSGSTALDLALGEFEGAHSGGELAHLVRFGILGRGLCGCGLQIAECPFWTQVFLTGDEVLADVFRRPQIYADASAMVSRRRYFRKILKHRELPVPIETILLHRSFRAALYARMDEIGKGAVIIDSSKSPVGAAELLLDPNVTPLFVHLVRDPRAVAFSTSNSQVQAADPSGRLMAQSPVRRAAATWVWTNAQAEAIQRQVQPAQFVRVRYEDLVEDPETTLNQVWVSAVEAGLVARVPRHVGASVNHTAWGNPMRLKTSGIVWKRDDRWVRGLDARSRRIVEAITAVQRGRYGYFKCRETN